MPERIQRKRTKGWRMPEGAVYVGRPTKWGNPFYVTTTASMPISKHGRWVVLDENLVDYWPFADTRRAAVAKSVELFEMNLTEWDCAQIRVSDVRRELAGHDLACWCPLDQPCHADVLLELANRSDR